MNQSRNEYENLKESFLEHFEKCRLINAAKIISNVFLICSNGDLQRREVNRTEVSEFLRKTRLEKFMVSVREVLVTRRSHSSNTWSETEHAAVLSSSSANLINQKHR